MAKFNVTRVTREGFHHHAAFAEVQDSVAWALASLGHDVSVTLNWFAEHGETNVILGTELMDDWISIPRNSIVYNLEQPSHPSMAKVRRLAKGLPVWDYSQRAVEEWKAAGHASVCHVPIGFTPNLIRIPRHVAPDIDVSFFGWPTPRRTALLDQLRSAGLNVYASANCYGGARDNILSRSRVCLNVHHDGRDRFEAVRCSYLMANSCCIVTEVSSDDDEYQDLRGLERSPYRILVDHCLTLCGGVMNLERSRRGEAALDSIRHRDYSTAIAATLDAAPPTSATIPVAPSRPLQHAIMRDTRKQGYLSEARHLKVQARYAATLASGDMKDFAAWLRDHAKGNILEIGVRDGASTSAFLTGVEEHGGHVYSIDVQDCSALFRDHPQWTFIHANSTDRETIFRQIPYELDILLIDGDHSRAGVMADLEYGRLVRPGGMILFHDIAPESKPDGCNDASWPGDDVRGVYEATCRGMATMGWTHEELPGRYGMGVLKRPAIVPDAFVKAYSPDVKMPIREDMLLREGK